MTKGSSEWWRVVVTPQDAKWIGNSHTSRWQNVRPEEGQVWVLLVGAILAVWLMHCALSHIESFSVLKSCKEYQKSPIWTSVAHVLLQQSWNVNCSHLAACDFRACHCPGHVGRGEVPSGDFFYVAWVRWTSECMHSCLLSTIYTLL